MAGKRTHVTVLKSETIEQLNVLTGRVYIDLTFGDGGHSDAVLLASGPTGKVIVFDSDKDSFGRGEKRFETYGERIQFVHANFAELGKVMQELGIKKVDGILADLGVSFEQLAGDASRGFSLKGAGPLDMRFDAGSGETALDLLRRVSVEELKKILVEYGELRVAMKVARAIKAGLENGAVKTTVDLAGVVKKAIPRRFHKRNIHPATTTFQAIRIAVNDELENLKAMLPQALDALRPGGRLAVIAYHSLEDRIVRHTFRHWAKDCICPPGLPVCACGKRSEVRIVTRRPITPTEAEIEANPSARSAKLRVAERI